MLKAKKCDRKARSTSDIRAARRTNPAKTAIDGKGAAAPAVPAAQPSTSAAGPGAPAAAAPAGPLETAGAPATASPAVHLPYPPPPMHPQNFLPYNPQVRRNLGSLCQRTRAHAHSSTAAQGTADVVGSMPVKRHFAE